jgi:hypothetical protein
VYDEKAWNKIRFDSKNIYCYYFFVHICTKMCEFIRRVYKIFLEIIWGQSYDK